MKVEEEKKREDEKNNEKVNESERKECKEKKKELLRTSFLCMYWCSATKHHLWKIGDNGVRYVRVSE